MTSEWLVYTRTVQQSDHLPVILDVWNYIRTLVLPDLNPDIVGRASVSAVRAFYTAVYGVRCLLEHSSPCFMETKLEGEGTCIGTLVLRSLLQAAAWHGDL